jgi:hypothetical protein
MRVVIVEGLYGGFLWWVGKQVGIVSIEVGLVRFSVLCVVEEKRVLCHFLTFATTHFHVLLGITITIISKLSNNPNAEPGEEIQTRSFCPRINPLLVVATEPAIDQVIVEEPTSDLWSLTRVILAIIFEQ